MSLRSPITRPRRLEVFAVGVSDAQLMWRLLGTGPVTVELDGRVVGRGPDARLGAVTIEGLSPATSAELVVRPEEGSAQTVRLTTLPPPPGQELARFATLSDLHLGLHSFGLTGRLRENPEPLVAHPARCARAAVTEAAAWGATELLIKGDLTHQSRDTDWDLVAELLEWCPLPSHLVVGNHDVQYRTERTPDEALDRIGVQRRRLHVLDRPGARIVLADFSIDLHRNGRIGPVADQVIDAAADTDSPVILALHYHLHRTIVPWFWPLGVGYRPATRFLKRLQAANPRILITCGHSHRNRRYRFDTIPITEVGSPKDYPGVWGGYILYEGGMIQTLRRVAHPDALAWTERTRRAVAGAWGLWSPGTLDQRSFTHCW